MNVGAPVAPARIAAVASAATWMGQVDFALDVRVRQDVTARVGAAVME